MLAFLWLASMTVQARADDDGAASMERRFKAAFLYKFSAYVDWPPEAFPSPLTPLVIAVAAADGIATELESAARAHSVGTHAIVVRRVHPGDALDGVQILFVGASDAARLAQWLRATEGRPVLAVTESQGALEQGSVINFVMEGRRVRFDISLASAERHQLRIDSRLLDVARHAVRAR
jgi:hypothetical protein